MDYHFIKNMEDLKIKKKFEFPISVLFIMLFFISVAITLILLSYYGVLTFPFLMENSHIAQNSNVLCPTNIEQMNKTCCEATETGEMKAVVSAVYVNADCECPYPTEYLQMAPEGGGTLYKICDCNCSE